MGKKTSGMEIPEELRTHKERMKRFIAAKQRLDIEQKERPAPKKKRSPSEKKKRNRPERKKEVGNRNNLKRLLKAGLWQM